MNYACAFLFTFNLAASAIMVKEVFGHLTVMVEAGRLSSLMKNAALAAITFEGAVSALSFLALLDGSAETLWLPGLYALAMALIYVWVWRFHRGRWGQNS